MKDRDTTWTWQEYPEFATNEVRGEYIRWFETYFEYSWEPSEGGGFRRSAYGDGMTQCVFCGALVMTGNQDRSLNIHRRWHDRNDREETDD